MSKQTVLIFLSVFLVGVETLACTTFLISGKYTRDGKSLLFKNRDTDEMQNSLVYFTDGKYNYIGLVDGSHEFETMVWGGYNETGFAIINSAAYNNNMGDTTKFDDQEGVVMKLALQTCRTILDFEKLLDSLPKPLGVDANFGVIDAYGGAAFYETGNYRYIKFDANDPIVSADGILVRTNHSKSADPEHGFGYCRYNTAVAAIHKAANENKITARFLFDNLSRNLYHSLTNTDLTLDIPKQRNVPEYKFFIDYIPRESTASAIMIVGAKNELHAQHTMMWTILGFPLTSVAVPVWISAGNKLPEVVSMNNKFQSPLCTAALEFKKECFPLTYDKGWNYINLSVVLNQEKNGYIQLIQSLEDPIFEKADLLSAGLDSGNKTKQDILDYYTWLDQYLSDSYEKHFDFKLFGDTK